MLNDIILHFDEKLNERPGETSGMFMMIFSLFCYSSGLVFFITVGMDKLVTSCFLGLGVAFQICIPVSGAIEMYCSKGCSENDTLIGMKNACSGACSLFWCCCYSDST